METAVTLWNGGLVGTADKGGCEGEVDVQESDSKHGQDLPSLPFRHVEFPDLEHGQRKDDQVQQDVDDRVRRRPDFETEAFPLGLAVPFQPGVFDGRALEGEEEDEGDALGDGDAEERVGDAVHGGCGEEADVEEEEGGFRGGQSGDVDDAADVEDFEDRVGRVDGDAPGVAAEVVRAG